MSLFVFSAENLRDSFKKLKIPQIALVKKLGISHQKVFRILNGYQPADPTILIQFQNIIRQLEQKKGGSHE
jgi:predicted transcriptional regulator